LLAEGKTDLLKGFISKKTNRKFEAFLMIKDGGTAFEFAPRERKTKAKGGAPKEPLPKIDFAGKTPLGKCPKCGARVFDAGMSYLCEKATGADKTCTFRTGKIILQQEISPEQVKKLLAEGKTDLLKGFVSKKNNRKFEAFLVIKDGGTVFKFLPRERKSRSRNAKPREPQPKIDFTGKEPLGKCPKCGGKVFETNGAYLCEKSQADKKPCRFRINREILQQPIEWVQAQKLLTNRKTDLLDKFISKSGKPFPAYLVMDEKGKVTFEFPPRTGEVQDWSK